jgi:hypothetical protein
MTVSEYKGNAPVPGCSGEQNASIEGLLKLCPDQSRWDGIRRAIFASLGGAGNYSDSAVTDATRQALTDYSGVSLPAGLFPTAGAAHAAQPHRAGPPTPRHR